MGSALPALFRPRVLAPIPGCLLVPLLVAQLGEEASWRYVEFFTASIRNPNTRRAYAMSDPKANAAEVAWRLSMTTTTLYTYLNGDGSPKAAGSAVLDGTASRGRPAAAG